AAACTHPWARARRRRSGLRAPADVSSAAASLPRRFASLVRIEHTVFALPFAYVGAFLAVDGFPGWGNLLWVTVAMVGARTLAMGLNRLIDAQPAHGDARDPVRAPHGLPGLGSLWHCARDLPRRGVPAQSGRALAVADPG